MAHGTSASRTRVRPAEYDRQRTLPHRATGAVVIALLVALWVSVVASRAAPGLEPIRQVLAIVILGVVPGMLLFAILRCRVDELGLVVLYSVALSVVGVTSATVAISAVYPLVGIGRPLTVDPLLGALTMGVLGLLAWSVVKDRPLVVPRPGFVIDRSDAVLTAGLGGLVLLAVAAGQAWTIYGSTMLMYPTVLAIVLMIGLMATPHIRERAYPATIFGIAAATMLHRSLMSRHVIGVDIQATYYVATVIRETGRWEIGTGGSLISLPVVTALPVVYSVLASMSIAYVYKVVFALLVAFLPVAVYYLGREYIGQRAGVFGALLVLFYHTTFYYTAEKEIVAELFLVCMLLALFRLERDGTGENVLLAALFGVAMVQAHYAVTLIYTLAMAAGVVGLRLATTVIGARRARGLSPEFVAALGMGSIGWYLITSETLAGRLIELPSSLLTQFGYLLSLNLAYLSEGSGAGVAQTQTAVFDQVSIALYALVMALAGIGALVIATRSTISIRERTRRMHAGTKPWISGSEVLVAIAFPLFAFLAMSVFVVADLNIDRAYQIVFVAVAPFVAVGYRAIRDVGASVIPGVRGRTIGWSPLVAVVLVIVLINTGLVPQVAGESNTATFDPETSDYVFSDAEVEAAAWLAENTDEGDRIRTDEHTKAVLRTTAIDDEQVRSIRDETGAVDLGESRYVVIRDRAVGEREAGATLTPSEREEIRASGETVFENEDVEIVER